MSQHDFEILTADANTGASFRLAVNAALQALASQSAGASEPATPYPYQTWVDTSTTPPTIRTRDGGNAAWVEPSTWSFRNRLINGTFQINQRALTTAADDAYIHDRFYVLTETGSVGISTLANAENGTPTMLRLTQPDVTAKRLGIAQIIESANCIDLRGKVVTFRVNRLRCSSSQPIRWAILEWTGTADTVTSDVVNSWTNGTFTAGQFFLGTNLTVAATGSMTPAAATLTTGSALTATVSSSCNNLIVMVWSEGTLAQNATLDLAKLQLEEAATATAFEVRPLATERMLCLYYFEILRSSGSTNREAICAGTWSGATTFEAIVPIVPKRIVPQVAVNTPTALDCVRAGISWHAVTSFTATGELSKTAAVLSLALSASGATGGDGGRLGFAASSAASIVADAEL